MWLNVLFPYTSEPVVQFVPWLWQHLKLHRRSRSSFDLFMGPPLCSRHKAYYRWSCFLVLIIVFLFTSPFKGSLERDRLLDQSHVQSKLEKLDILEKEYSRLTTMQSIAEVCHVSWNLYQICFVICSYMAIAELSKTLCFRVRQQLNFIKLRCCENLKLLLKVYMSR